MGEIITTGDGKDSGNADKINGQTTGQTGGRSGESTNSTDTRTAQGRTIGDSIGGRAGGQAGGQTEKAESTGLSLLTDEEKAKYSTASEDEKKRLLRNAKRRERYAQDKKAGGQTVRPRKVNRKKQEQQSLDTASLNLFVAGIFGVIASRPNCEHWLLNEKEIESITTPLSKMLAESEQFKNIGQYSNQIALVMACVTVFVPRMMITIQKKEEEKKIARTGQHTDTNPKRADIGTSKNSNNQVARRSDKHTTPNGSNNDNDVSIYGVPLC